MSTHTPGPWTIEPYDTRYDKSIMVLEPRAFIDNDDVDHAEAAANARLIAAAPDMLAALKELIAPLGPGGYHPSAGKPATDRARATIAKAEAQP